MIKVVSDGLHRVSMGWVTLLALVVFVLFTALVLPSESASSADAEGVGSPDTSFFYTPTELYRMAEAYGPEGRSAYVRARATFDVIWPVVYTAFLATALSWLTRRGFATGSLWQRAHLAPVLGLLFDYLEGIAASIVMLRYPERTAVIHSLAPLFTMAKWLCVGGSFVLLVLVAVVALIRIAERRGAR
jgi:hypothetical protein